MSLLWGVTVEGLGLLGSPCLEPVLNRDAFILHGKRRGARRVRRVLRRHQVAHASRWLAMDLGARDITIHAVWWRNDAGQLELIHAEEVARATP